MLFLKGPLFRQNDFNQGQLYRCLLISLLHSKILRAKLVFDPSILTNKGMYAVFQKLRDM